MKLWYENIETDSPFQASYDSAPEHDSHIRTHCWFFEPHGRLDVDMTYEQFHADRDAKCILFSDGHHPFEVEESYYLMKYSRKSPIRFKGIVRKLISWNSLPLETRKLLEKVYEIILEEM